MAKPRLVTGLQSSGALHLGSYLGTIRHWSGFSKSHDCYFFVADQHAITVAQDPSLFRTCTLDTAALLIASGLPEQTVFLQSHVPQHSELAWIFSCLTPIGELNRMTQYKEKSLTTKQQSGLGLYAYPCLMAADILLYNPTHVPVGADQKQHLELTRNIAERFNRDFGDTFNIPNPFIVGNASRVMALQNPTSKMSKSDSVTANTVFLLDDAKTVLKKIKRAVTDSKGLVAHDPERPGISNLVNIYADLSQQSTDEVALSYQNSGYAAFKKDLAELITHTLNPIQGRYHQIKEDTQALKTLLEKGRVKAQALAAKQLATVKERMGFIAYEA